MESIILTQTTLLMMATGFMACLALTLYQMMERSSIALPSRQLLTQGAIMTMLGTLLYAGLVSSNITQTSAGILSMSGSTSIFAMDAAAVPSAMAFAIWMVALPMLCAMISGVAGTSESVMQTKSRLTIAAVVMVLTSFLTSAMTAVQSISTMSWVSYALSLIAFAYIVVQIHTTLSDAAEGRSPAYQAGFSSLRAIMTFAVGLFPAVSLLTKLGVLTAQGAIETLILDLAMLAIFAGAGWVAMTTARSAGKTTLDQAANDVDITVSGISAGGSSKAA